MPEPDQPGGGDDPGEDRLASLDRRVKDALGVREARTRAAAERAAQMASRRGSSAAWRIVINLVVATSLGGAAGLGVDRWLGSTPWVMCAGLFVGFGLGMYMAARAANAMNQPAPRKDG